MPPLREYSDKFQQATEKWISAVRSSRCYTISYFGSKIWPFPSKNRCERGFLVCIAALITRETVALPCFRHTRLMLASLAITSRLFSTFLGRAFS